MIRLEDVNLSINGEPILTDISFEIPKGMTGVMLGASGSGKTTILRVVLGLYKPDSGRVFIDGQDICEMDDEALYAVRSGMGMVFQHGALFDSLTVGENVGYRLKERKFCPSTSKEPQVCSDDHIEACVRKSLSFVSLEETIDQMPSELSGGMKKRVAIARGIAAEPGMMLYDEPTAGLDPLNAFNISSLISRLRDEQGVTSIVVTHEIAVAFRVADRIAFIDGGRLIYMGDKNGFKTNDNEKIRKFMVYAGFAEDDGANGPAGVKK